MLNEQILHNIVLILYFCYQIIVEKFLVILIKTPNTMLIEMSFHIIGESKLSLV